MRATDDSPYKGVRGGSAKLEKDSRGRLSLQRGFSI